MDFCYFLQSFFSEEPVELVFVHDVASAKEKIMENDYRSIILDKDLPDGSGIELAEWIRFNLKKEILLCLITGGQLSLREYEYLKGDLKLKFMLAKPLSEHIATVFTRELVAHINEKHQQPSR